MERLMVRLSLWARDVAFFCRDVRNFYAIERRDGVNVLMAATRAVRFAATCPF